MSSAHVTVGLSAGEVVTPASAIHLDFEKRMDSCHANDIVRLIVAGKPWRLKVQVSRDGHHGEFLLPAKAIGPCDLHILDPHSKASRIQCRIPFSIVSITGKVPRSQRIGQVVRLRAQEFQLERLELADNDGPFIDVVKVGNREGGPYNRIAFDQTGAVVDFASVVAGVEQRRAAKYGRIHEALFERMSQAGENEPFDVVIWVPVSLSPDPFPRSTCEPGQQRSPEEARFLEDLQAKVARLCDVLKELGLEKGEPSDDGPGDGEVRDDETAPFVRATATSSQIRDLARRSEVGGIFFDDPIGFDTLGTSLRLSGASSTLEEGVKGSGIRVALWESGPSDATKLDIADRYETPGETSGHAILTTAIIKNTAPNAPRGYAPDCWTYSANSHDTLAFQWALKQQCTVINQSFTRRDAIFASGLDQDDLLKDYYVRLSPFPLIVQSAGNLTAGVPLGSDYVNHKGYNSLTVANHDENFEVAADSTFRNPVSVHSDRELPILSANGTTISALGLEPASGTSFAAPAVAGVAAQLQSVDRQLILWPVASRAILTASARRNFSTTWSQDVACKMDSRGGAGNLDARAALQIARSRYRAGSGPVPFAWDVQRLVFDQSGTATSKYLLAAGSETENPTAFISVCWNSAIETEEGALIASFLSVDLDLQVRDTATRAIVASSASYDNSYEVIQFCPEPGRTYELLVVRSSGSDEVDVGIAWIVRANLE